MRPTLEQDAVKHQSRVLAGCDGVPLGPVVCGGGGGHPCRLVRAGFQPPGPSVNKPAVLESFPRLGAERPGPPGWKPRLTGRQGCPPPQQQWQDAPV